MAVMSLSLQRCIVNVSRSSQCNDEVENLHVIFFSNIDMVVGPTTQSFSPIFVSLLRVSDLQEVKFSIFPLSLLLIVTTVLAASDNSC